MQKKTKPSARAAARVRESEGPRSGVRKKKPTGRSKDTALPKRKATPSKPPKRKATLAKKTKRTSIPPALEGPLGTAITRTLSALQSFTRSESQRIEQQGLANLFAAAGLSPEGTLTPPGPERTELAAALRELLQLVDPPAVEPATITMAVLPDETPTKPSLDVVPEVPAASTVCAEGEEILEDSDRGKILRRKPAPKEDAALAPPCDPAVVVEEAALPAPEPLPTVPRPQAPKGVSVIGPSDSDVQSAQALMQNVEALSKVFRQEPAPRLEALLQALVAENRLLLERFPEWHPIFQPLSQTIPVLSRIRAQSGMTAFIQGLARAHQYNWHRIWREASERVARFDADTALSPSKAAAAPVRKEKPKEKPKDVAAVCPWPSLFSFHKAGNTLALVGGLIVPDKLRSIQKRWGLTAEWIEVDQGVTRVGEAVASRIESGRIGAVVVLEGLLSRGVSDRIVSSAKAKGTPFAMADRGGTAHLERALGEIEFKLSKRVSAVAC